MSYITTRYTAGRSPRTRLDCRIDIRYGRTIRLFATYQQKRGSLLRDYVQCLGIDATDAVDLVDSLLGAIGQLPVPRLASQLHLLRRIRDRADAYIAIAETFEKKHPTTKWRFVRPGLYDPGTPTQIMRGYYGHGTYTQALDEVHRNYPDSWAGSFSLCTDYHPNGAPK